LKFEVQSLKFLSKESFVAINSGKVVLGGLVAGVVANLLDYVFQGIVLRPDFETMQQRLNLDPAAASNPVPWIVVDFVLGFLLIISYFGFRVRWGPGPRPPSTRAS